MFIRNIIIALLLSYSQLCFSQNIEFNPNVRSIADLEILIPKISSDLLKVYSDSDPLDYLDNLMRIKISAGKYREAMNALDSLQQLLGFSKDSSLAALGIQFRCYAETKMRALADSTDFKTLYIQTFSSIFQNLPESAKPIAEMFFSADTLTIHKELMRLIEECSGKQLINSNMAVQIVRNWNSLNVMRKIQEPSKEYLEIENNKKYIIQDSLLISGSGGAKIPVMVIRSKEFIQPIPAVIMNTIYAGSSDKTKAKEAANKGYAGIIINTRGKKNSPDVIEPFEHDGDDIRSVLDWLGTQTWFNGKAGMYGGSYLGFSQWAATKKMHPALKTIVPQVSVGFGIDFPRINGIYYGYMLQWLHYVTNNKFTDLPEFNNEEKWKQLFIKWYTLGLPFKKLDSLEGRKMPLFQRWLAHPSFDQYWQHTIPVAEDFKKIDIPILSITGYFDDDQRGAMHYYEEHQKWNPESNHYLFIGPFDHYGAQSMPSVIVNGYTIDSVASVNISELIWDWFAFTLQGGAKPKQLLDKVTYQAMGTNTWKGAKDLKSFNNDTLTLYLSHQNMSNGFRLTQKLPLSQNWLEHVTDFKERPVIDYTIQTQALTKKVPHPRENLIFISDTLSKDFMMNGSLMGNIEMQMNKKDADLLFELYELMPDSSYFLLSYTNQRLSYISNPMKRILLQPGQVYHMPIYNATMTSKLIHKGSRLVLYAGPIKDFNSEINYGTGKPVSEESIQDAKIPLIIKWSSRSSIKIPILK